MELYPEDDQELYSYMSYEERKMHERLIEYALEKKRAQVRIPEK